VKVTVKKWGNSAAVRIPAAVMQSVRLNLNDIVDVREEDGHIIVEPVRQKAYVLDDLLDGITAKNRHAEIDFGIPVGEEVS
jgi:antitoxin MazE